MRKRTINTYNAMLNATVQEIGGGHVATVWAGKITQGASTEAIMAIVTRRAKEIAAIPQIIEAAQDLINRLDDKDLDPRQRAALRKLQRGIAKAVAL